MGAMAFDLSPVAGIAGAAARPLSPRAVGLVLLALGMGGFAIGTSEFVVMGLMQEIARRHGGNFYYPTSSNQLPRIFIREATVVRRSMISEEPFTPDLQRPSEALPGFSMGAMPGLGGHVVTEAADGADVPFACR